MGLVNKEGEQIIEKINEKHAFFSVFIKRYFYWIIIIKIM